MAAPLVVEFASLLRQQLLCRPYDASSTASEIARMDSQLLAVASLEEGAGTSPSLLYLAACAGDAPAVRALLRADARPLPCEDMYAVAGEWAAGTSDANMCRIVSELFHAGMTVPLTDAGPSPATVMCMNKEWHTSLCVLARADPWAMHALQRTPACVASAEAARQAAQAGAKAINRSEVGAVGKAAQQLRAVVKDATVWGSWDGTPQLARARLAMHAVIQTHVEAGTLGVIVTRGALSIMDVALNTRDVDVILALLRAGAAVSDYRNLYTRCARTGVMTVDASGAPVGDARLAVYLQHMHNAGAVIPEDGHASCASEFAVKGLYACLPVLVEVIDPNARVVDDTGYTLLHRAAEAVNASACTYLISAGFDVTARTSDGVTPLGCLLRLSTGSVAAICDTIQALTTGVQDVGSAIRACGACDHPDAPLYVRTPGNSRESLRPFERLFGAYLLLHVIAAVRAYPSAPQRSLLEDFVPVDAQARGMQTFRTLALDVHSGGGLYIPDQLRAGGDAARAVKLAVSVDAFFDLQPHYDQEIDDGTPAAAVWHDLLYEDLARSVSPTLRSWAYMRRIHATRRRRR